MGPVKKTVRWLLPACTLFLAVNAGCLNTYVFSKSTVIAAMPDRIFSVLSDFNSYPKFFPELHKQVNIISRVKEGKGVLFENVSEFKGHVVRSVWEVVEFKKDRMIRMENPLYGTIIVLLSQIDYNTSEENMIVVTNLPPGMKNEIFSLYEKQMATVKEVSER
jgi:hypothetical protein